MDTKEHTNNSITYSTEKETYTLTPLDIGNLRKRFLEHIPADMEDISESDEDEEQSDCKTGSLDVFKQNNLDLKVTENVSKHECLNIIQYKKQTSNAKDTVARAKEKNNKSQLILLEPLNLSKNNTKNDSFDLDFSALSIHTPAKSKDNNFNFTTPRINIIPSSATKCLKKGPLFHTPNVSSLKNGKMPLLETPANKGLNTVNYSAKKVGNTFYQPVRTPIHPAVTKSSIPSIIYPNCEQSIFIVNNNEYIVMNLIGKGGSSAVYHCLQPEEKIHVAIKVVNLSDSNTEGYINEIKCLESLQTCDRIIKMHDFEVQENQLLVVLEKGDEDLSTILKQIAGRQSRLPNYMLLFYWMEMLYAVKQIHMNGIIHSDLKPANFIWVERGLKLIDFGIASIVQEDMTCVYKSFQEGSCNYISPEALNVQTHENANSPNGQPKYKIHFKSDVWSLGCILYQLVYCQTPFQHLNQLWSKLAAIVDPKLVINYPKADWVSPKIMRTIKSCLQHDVKARPSIDELITEYEQIF